MTQKEKDYLTGALIKAVDGRKGVVEIIKNERIYVESEDGTQFDICHDELDDVLKSAETLEDEEYYRSIEEEY